MKTKEVFIVSKLRPNIEISALGRPVTLDFKDLADGCIGVTLVFSNLQDAVEYNNGDPNNIMKGQVTDENHNNSI